MTTSSAAAPPSYGRIRELPGRLFDLGVIAALLVVGAVIVLGSTNEIPRFAPDRAPLGLLLLVPLMSLLVRRRHPWVTFGVIIGSLVVGALLRSPTVVQPLVLVGVYTVSSRTGWRVSLLAAAGALAVYVAAVSVAGDRSPLPAIASGLVPIAAAYVAGAYVRTRFAYIDSLQARAEQTDRERELLAQRAVAEERVRIARELHDVVAHHLSLITVQASALQTQLAEGDPARDTVETIARTGRQAMDEMRRMLGVLRLRAADTPDHAPQPGIDEIPMLIDQARDAGLEVTLAVDGERRPVPPGVDLSAYRIVQEALTNVLRHAGPARCRVSVAYDPLRLELRITDDGQGGRAPEPGGGHGLVGMRERTALFGGDLFAGPVPGGGYAVRATLPLNSGGGPT